MNLQGIHHVALIVSDYPKSREFYVDKLGFPVLQEKYRQEQGDWKLLLQAGDCLLEIFGMEHAPARPDAPEACGLRHLAFYVEDIEETVAWLNGMGIETDPIGWDAFTNNRYAFFRDPDGLPLELHE